MLALIGAIPLVGKLAIVGVLVASVGGGLTWLSVSQFNKGYNAAIADIAAENKEAVDAANKARQTVRDCNARGGGWDQSRGLCL